MITAGGGAGFENGDDGTELLAITSTAASSVTSVLEANGANIRLVRSDNPSTNCDSMPLVSIFSIASVSADSVWKFCGSEDTHHKATKAVKTIAPENAN